MVFLPSRGPPLKPLPRRKAETFAASSAAAAAAAATSSPASASPPTHASSSPRPAAASPPSPPSQPSSVRSVWPSRRAFCAASSSSRRCASSILIIAKACRRSSSGLRAGLSLSGGGALCALASASFSSCSRTCFSHSSLVARQRSSASSSDWRRSPCRWLRAFGGLRRTGLPSSGAADASALAASALAARAAFISFDGATKPTPARSPSPTRFSSAPSRRISGSYSLVPVVQPTVSACWGWFGW
mmetsp:Transcript_72903/g.213869  ORF Transcript_72903/g.213869 Transcript_72903/m.213869 type:complete len:245 (+) Transcript_72903:256-990(+)